MLILGIESSCDETAAAVLADGNTLLSDVVNSQISIHETYGGVVPELASRKHTENIYPVVQEALNQAQITIDELDGIAVTRGPGLIGSLLVGYSFAKALSLVSRIPYIGVDHIAGHLLSVFLAAEKPSFPYIALIASGGHSSIFYVEDYTTYKILGRTRDDAAGEAFDKVAKLLDLGYPGGPIISKVAEAGVPDAIAFPRAWLGKDSYDFSFSGLKTAVANFIRNPGKEKLPVADICTSFQEAVVEVLVEKTFQAALFTKVDNVVLAGGVAANPRLREAITERGNKEKINVSMPPKHFCSDNAAMIALAGYHFFEKEATLSPDTDVYSRSQFIAFQ
jgi:N6-L-threonylcarbamoyladenine synthase